MPTHSSACNGFPKARRVLPLSFILVGTALVLIATLQGCASLSEEDCLSADWAVMGEVDGQQGRPLSDINRYRRQCAAYGVVPDTEAYLEARERGLVVYCTNRNGYHEGRAGAPHNLVCPATLEPDFRGGYELGRAVYASLNELRAGNAAIGSNRDEIEELRSDIAEGEESIRSDDLNDEETQRQRGEIDAMKKRIKQLESRLVVLTGSVAISIGQYRNAVAAARRDGHDEPMEADLLQGLLRLIR